MRYSGLLSKEQHGPFKGFKGLAIRILLIFPGKVGLLATLIVELLMDVA